MSVRHFPDREFCPVTGQTGNKWGKTEDGLFFVYGDHSPLPGWRHQKEGSNGCDVYRHESTLTCNPRPVKRRDSQATPARDTLETFHLVYSALLSVARLNDEEWQRLTTERPCLCSHHRDLIGYLPAGNCEEGKQARYRIASEVERIVSLLHGIERTQLLRVPGFEEQGGKLTVKGWGGHLLPYQTPQGKIWGIQIRKENPKAGDNRYSWWKGVSARPGILQPYPHRRKADKPEWCHITEGPYKAYALQTIDSDNPVMVVPGVSSNAIPGLVAEIGAKGVCLWVDSDWKVKPSVRKQLDKLIYNLKDYSISIAVWDGGKGIDDYLAAGGKVEDIEYLTPHQWREIAEIETLKQAGKLHNKNTFRSKEGFRQWFKAINESGGLGPGFHVFKIPAGWGKTHLMSEETKNGSVLAVAPKRSIVDALAERFDAVHYDECPDKFGSIPRVATCFPSLPRAIPGEYDSVVFDEISESLAQLDSSVISNSNTVLNAMVCLMNQAKKRLIADAYITDEHIEALATLTGHSIESFHIYKQDEQAKPKRGETLALHPSVDALTVELKQAMEAGENVAIFCTKASQAEQLSVLVSKAGCKNLLITGETEKDLSDVNTLWSQYQAVIASPAVTSGVSFDVEHFDRVFIYGEQFNDPNKGRRAVPKEVFLQMSARIRQTKQHRIDAFLPDAWDSRNDLESVQDEAFSMILGDKLTKDQLRQTGEYLSDSSLNSPDVVAISACRYVQTIHSKDLRHSVSSEWKKEGGTVITIKPDTSAVAFVKEERKQASAKVKELKCESVLNAEEIEEQEAGYLEKKAFLSPPESDSLTRYRITQDLPGFLDWSDEEQRNAINNYPNDRAAAKRLELADAYVRGDIKALNLDDLKRAQAGGVTLDHNGERMKLFDTLLRLAGFSLKELIEGKSFQWNQKILEEKKFDLSAMILLENTPHSVRRGLHRGRIENDHGSRLLSSLFQSLGFKNEAKRIRINGKQVSQQTVTPSTGFEIWGRRKAVQSRCIE